LVQELRGAQVVQSREQALTQLQDEVLLLLRQPHRVSPVVVVLLTELVMPPILSTKRPGEGVP
jgi:hypothetical protein